jgi:hypothetical protein
MQVKDNDPPTTWEDTILTMVIAALNDGQTTPARIRRLVTAAIQAVEEFDIYRL